MMLQITSKRKAGDSGMATLIPSLGSCAARMTSGERRLAERLEQKLDDDYLLWYDVPIGPKQAHPDFVVLHPRRGLLILETKDWKPETILQADKESWGILVDGRPKTVPSPMEQARQYAHQVVNALERDPPLVQADGKYQGKLAFPWSYGVVFTNLTRKQFTEGGLGQVMAPNRVLCSDEMLPAIEAEALQSRLWNMFPHRFHLGILTLPQLDRVRWIMFPDIRVQLQGALFDDRDEEATLPDIMRVMDLQQEQLARSLGDGHRVIHGVAGSGKTMILGYRAEYLAKANTPGAKPILILCFNEPLAVKLASVMAAKGLASRVNSVHFHKWARAQLVQYGQGLPAPNRDQDAFFADMVERVILGLDRKHIPSGQYQAILIDEGHDFAPEWLKLITQMVDPATNRLLVLCDDAQKIYERGRSRQFSFKSVGIQAQGRTTILKINYRNTRQILQVASLIAGDLLTPDEQDEDGIPLLKPISCGRDGEAPLIVRLPSFKEETFRIADLLSAAHQEGHAWGNMAIICRHNWMRDKCASALQQRGLPHETRIGPGTFNPNTDSIKLLRMDVCKGLEFAVVALPGLGYMPTIGEDEREEARLFYVAATRATQRLVVTASGDGGLWWRRM
jgi:hypothetical protein